MPKSPYKTTTEVYNTLGQKYLDDSKKVTPPGRLPFSKLFKKGDTIFDVGCGGGRDAQFFIKKGFKVIGVDTSSVLIELARKAEPKATFQCADLLTVKFPKDTFNGIWAQAVLLHLKRNDVPKALKKFYSILKKDGVLHIRVKKGKGEAYVKEKLSGYHERFYTYFSKTEMESMVKSQGFKIIDSKIEPDEFRRPGMLWISIWAKK